MKATNYILILALVICIVFISGCAQKEGTATSKGLESAIDFSATYPASASDVSGFEFQKTGASFIVYYHADSEAAANKVLAVLEQAGVSLYGKYLGAMTGKIPAFISTDVDEYVLVAGFPGGKENVAVGDGSAPNGKIYLYKPFGENSGKTGGVVIHEGAHAVAFQIMAQPNIQYLPGFLNEGQAYFNEYVYKAGKDFKPLEQIYFASLLEKSVKTGNPKTMNLEELGKDCDNYISDETLNGMCRGQGTFTVWYLIENYGDDAFARFVADLKQTKGWQESLSKVTGKTTSEFGAEVNDKLKELIK